jgi:hypothetical protein
MLVDVGGTQVGLMAVGVAVDVGVVDDEPVIWMHPVTGIMASATMSTRVMNVAFKFSFFIFVFPSEIIL